MPFDKSHGIRSDCLPTAASSMYSEADTGLRIGELSIFEVGLYEVMMHSQSVTFCRWCTVESFIGEEGRNS